MISIIYLSFIIGFCSTIIAIPFWIKRAKYAKLVGKDLHKIDNREIAEMGGITVIFGFLAAISTYIATRTFILEDNTYILEILAVLSTILIAAIIGIIDDILGWRLGLRQWQKPILTLIAALPLVVINIGETHVNIPGLGTINLGILYPLLIIPIAIVGSSNAFNMLAGYNGLESGMGILMISFLGYTSYLTGNNFATVISLCMLFPLLAFYLFNRYPAKIFPGDSLTYTIGAMIAIIAILGNIERIALIIFIPYFIEFLLKIRGLFQKQSFAKIEKNGELELPYKEIYSLPHISIVTLKKLKIKSTEKNIVYSIYLFETLFIIIAMVTVWR